MLEILPNYHPILVHFTVALFSVSTALFVVLKLGGRYLPDATRDAMGTVARWNLWLGIGATLFTVAAGFHAYSTVAHDAPSHAAMTDHRNWAIATLILFLILAGWSIVRKTSVRTPGTLFVVMMLITQLVLISTAWRGGELVYRFGLGVLSLPQAENGGHGHGGDENHTHAPASSPGDSKPPAAMAVFVINSESGESGQAGPTALTDQTHQHEGKHVKPAPPRSHSHSHDDDPAHEAEHGH